MQVGKSLLLHVSLPFLERFGGTPGIPPPRPLSWGPTCVCPPVLPLRSLEASSCLLAVFFCLAFSPPSRVLLWDAMSAEGKLLARPAQFLIPGDEVCKHFEVEYDMLATALNAEPHVTMWTLDASQHPEIAGEYGVKTFPMVKLFRR